MANFCEARRGRVVMTLFSLALTLSAIGCGGSSPSASSGSGSSTSAGTSHVPASGYDVYGVDLSNVLFRANSHAITSVTAVGTISGLQAGEKILGVAFSPEGDLYALGSTAQIYTLNLSTAAATAVGTGFGSTNPLVGGHVGFSFNMATYHLLVTSDAGQNLELNSSTGSVFADRSSLAYDTTDAHAGTSAKVVASSTTCNCVAAPTVYGVESTLGTWVTIGSVNGAPSDSSTGSLFTVSSLGIDVSGTLALTIPVASDYAYLASGATADSASKLYQIQLTTGVPTLLGTLGGIGKIRSLSVHP